MNKKERRDKIHSKILNREFIASGIFIILFVLLLYVAADLLEIIIPIKLKAYLYLSLTVVLCIILIIVAYAISAFITAPIEKRLNKNLWKELKGLNNYHC